MAWAPLVVAIEREAAPRRRLVVRWSLPRPDNWMSAPAVTVTPRDVARAIRRAIEDGWTPAVGGKPFELRQFT